MNTTTLLKVINHHPNDDRISFQELGHKYFIDGDNTNTISCTTYIHSFFNEFESDKIINNIIGSSKWKTDNTYKYYQMSKKDIKKQWNANSKLSCNLGTKMHLMIENFYNDKEIEITDNDKDFEIFLDFYNDHKHLQIYRTEWIIFADDLRITGSIDAVFINKDGSLTLGDWKRSKQINFTSYNNQTGKPPFEHLSDCNYNHYSLQLNLYRIILEKYYGFTVKDMFLGVFHPDNDKYIKIDIQRMDKEAELLLNFKKNH